MDTFSSTEVTAGGVDQNLRPAKNHGSLVENFRNDDDLGYINDRGWEPLLNQPIIAGAVTEASYIETFSPVRFTQVWSRHQDAEVYYMYEKFGKLQYDFGNEGSSTGRNIVLDSNRNIPKVDDPGTQLVPYGRFALVMNGHDRPQKFWGRSIMEPFSWTSAPPAPRPLGVDPSVVAEGGVQSPLDGGSATLKFVTGSTVIGMGQTTLGDINLYSYRATFISNTGSESPLSAATSVTWVIGGNGSSNYQSYRFAICIQDMPIGPHGTVKRRLYRTKNKRDGQTGAGDVYYLVAEINENVSTFYIDVIPDNQLVTSIDTATFAQPISHGYKYGAAWNNQMWLAGGDANSTRIIFSKPNLPEEFPRFNYFDVGVRQGGAIRALYPYYNSLLVFRERAIDVITVAGVGSDGTPAYTISSLDQNIGTSATNTIQLVPDVGLVFLTRNGFYSITGGLQGGAVHRVQKISDPINKEMKRLTVTALARATAVYSDREKEYWCHYPADGGTENVRGAVLHTRSLQWSLRNSPAMKFTGLSVDPNGWIIMGLWNDPTIVKTAQTGDKTGLQVWSAAPHWGHYLTYVSTSGQGTITYTVSQRPRGTSTWRSIWEDFGDSNIKKQVMHIEVEVVTSGDNEVELFFGRDHEDSYTSAGKVSPQTTENYGTTSSQPVYGPGANAKYAATWDKTKWTDGHVTRMRWDPKSEMCSHFLFELRSSGLFHILAYKIEYRPAGQKTIHQRGPK
jgi:hypothetical protein